MINLRRRSQLFLVRCAAAPAGLPPTPILTNLACFELFSDCRGQAPATGATPRFASFLPQVGGRRGGVRGAGRLAALLLLSSSESIALHVSAALGPSSSVDLVISVGLGGVAQKLALPRHLREASALVIRHILVNQTARVRDLPLLRDVVVLHCHPQRVFIGLDQATNVRDVELVDISAVAEVVRDIHCFRGAL